LEDEFEREKEQEIDEDAPKETDVTLPGWGSWAGAGMESKRPKRRFLLPPKPDAVDPSKRQDKKLKHVIISEKKDKKFVENYQVSKVPFPYQSKDQFEAMTRQPIGKEWSTARTFSQNVKPRIIVPGGLIIDPLRK
jgi:U3 small nucleolar RNA-associated protein 14